MEKLVIGACSNIDTIRNKEKEGTKFLNGASIYSGFAAAAKTSTRVITCVGEEEENDKQIIVRATAKGKPICEERDFAGITQKVVTVGNKSYIPNRR